MIDLTKITEEQMEEYRLEKNVHYGMNFINIKGTDFWVLGIDETTNTIYAQFDYGKISWDHIRWLADEKYCIVGVLTQHIPGLYDTRGIEYYEDDELINEAYNYVDDETVFIIKKGGENL